MSLQFTSVRSAFVNSCVTNWRNWLTGPAAGLTGQREARFRAAVNQMTAFMIPPHVVFAPTSGWGAFNWTSWRLKVNNRYTQKSDIRYADFVEVCSTIYHETRHAEQFYRIAQGLASGQLKFPDVSTAQTIQAMGRSGGSVRARAAMFDSAARGQDPLQSDSAARVRVIAERLDIPQNVATHANNFRDYFQNYVNSTRPEWFKRATILDEVNEWMRATYKKTFSEMDTWAQGDEGPYRVYRDLPEENDAHGIEDRVQAELFRSIGNDTPANRKKKRNDPIFGP